MNHEARKSQWSRLAIAGLVVTVLAGTAWGQNNAISKKVQYTVIDLAPSATTNCVPSTPPACSQAFDVTNDGLSTGWVSAANASSHAALWYKGMFSDIGVPGLGGATSNSVAFTANERGQAVGEAETTTDDPNRENFCSYGTGLECRAFLWQQGKMNALPFPPGGGNNSGAVSINSLRQIAGVAETSIVDRGCSAPQMFDFEAVIWGPGPGEVKELRLPPGDTVGEALWINDLGEAVGTTGSCSSTTPPPLAVGSHAVFWEDESPIDLGNLGGRCQNLCVSQLLGLFGNTALYINNSGDVVGVSALAGETTYHAFLWTKQTRKMQDLGTVPGHLASVGLAINEAGDVVGASFDSSGTPHAFLRHNELMNDLNDLAVDSPFLLLLVAQFINASGEIVGFGLTNSFEVHAFLATPESDAGAGTALRTTNGRPNLSLPEAVRKQILREFRFRRP